MTALTNLPPLALPSIMPGGKGTAQKHLGDGAFLTGLLTAQSSRIVLGLTALAGSLSGGIAPLADKRQSDRRPARIVKLGHQHCAKVLPRRAPQKPPLPDPAGDRSSRGKYPRLSLRPIVPLHRGLPIHSWLGGRPHMPAETPWPMAGGKPALFLAQISCAHLPPRLWGKRGPRDGWLLAFTPQDTPGEPILRHVPRFGPERQAPGPLHYPNLAPVRADVLARATGDPSAIPRWPVEILDTSRSDPCDTAHAKLDAAPVDPDLTDPRFQPFDWGSAMVLLDSLLTEVDWQHSVVSALVDPDAPDANTLHFVDSLARTRQGIAALQAELCGARTAGLDFSPELRDLVLHGLDCLTLESTARTDDGEQTQITTKLLENDHIRQSYFRWFDHYARRLYTDRPEDLPQPQRRLFENHWIRLAKSEPGEMGGDPDKDGTEMTVLHLPTSELMGWSFATSDGFHIALTKDQLASGAFDIGGDPLPDTA